MNHLRHSPSLPACVHSRRPGFTLIEVLTTITIIALVAALAFPLFQRGLASARQGQCISNLKQMGVLFSLYAAENDGYCPPALNPEKTRTWRSLLAGLYMGPDVVTTLPGMASPAYDTFWCPVYKEKYPRRDNIMGRGSYSLNWYFDNNVTGLRPRLAGLKGAVEPLVVDGWPRDDNALFGAYGTFRTLSQGEAGGSGDYHPGETFNALYADGHVEALNAEKAAPAEADVRVRVTFE